MSALQPLFPGWSNPLSVAGFVACRFLCNCVLTAVAARSAGRESPLTVAVAASTLLSAAMTVSLLRPGGLGYDASFVEIGVQVVLLALVGVAVYSNPSIRRAVVAVGVAVIAVGLLFVTVILYGEMFVAP